MGGGANHGFVIDNAAGVEDGVIADLAVSADQGAGGDDHISAERDVMSQIGRRVDRIDEFKAHFADLIGKGPADAIVAYGDDGAVHALGAKVGQGVDAADNGHAVHSPAV